MDLPQRKEKCRVLLTKRGEELLRQSAKLSFSFQEFCTYSRQEFYFNKTKGAYSFKLKEGLMTGRSYELLIEFIMNLIDILIDNKSYTLL